jgi:hypothetical protein
MKRQDLRRRVGGWVTFALLTALVLGGSGGRGDGTTAVAAAPEPATTTAGDQVDVAVTVYNSNIALVRDVRELTLPAGASDLRFVDIASSVRPTTVRFRSLSDAARLRVVEQNYQYDLLEPAKLLQKYVGRDVILVRRRDRNGTTVDEEVTARLLAFNNGPVWRIGSEIVTGMPADHYRFPDLPENLYSRPTLVWTLENGGGARQRVEASYLAGEMTWSADYVLTVGRDDRSADLDSWVTLSNNSGAAFRNARLQLVAGELNRVRQEQLAMREAVTARSPAASADFAQEGFSDYHLYTLARRTTLQDRETKQISLLSGSGVPVKKRYVVDGQSFYYRNAHQPGRPLRDPVRVYYRFRNDEASGLGVPLPAGIVRVYQADSRGGLQFAGEDRIGHTPKDEALDLHIGNAFDIVAERKQTSYDKIASNVVELSFEISLRNRKEAPVTIEVNEPLGGSWEMLRASHRSTKTSAWSARFEVPVGAGEEATLTYSVRVRW